MCLFHIFWKLFCLFSLIFSTIFILYFRNFFPTSTGKKSKLLKRLQVFIFILIIYFIFYLCIGPYFFIFILFCYLDLLTQTSSELFFFKQIFHLVKCLVRYFLPKLLLFACLAFITYQYYIILTDTTRCFKSQYDRLKIL